MESQDQREQLLLYKEEMQQELLHLLAYWEKYTVDDIHGGFQGLVDANNGVIEGAAKGVVLNARILWSFSAAATFLQAPGWLVLANRAYEYILEYFVDRVNGGLYWSVDVAGQTLDMKKQVYAQAFGIYALSAYYRATQLEEARQLAIDLYRLVVEKAFDVANTGFLEAFTTDWMPIADLRLSEKDENMPKSMNTHLHVLEAFFTLYEIWPEPELQGHVQQLLNNFYKYIIHPATFHLHLFFDMNWVAFGDTISFGHDIEAAWLLHEAALVAGTEKQKEFTRENAIRMGRAAAEGLDTDGSLWYEREQAAGFWILEKHWWPQAEAMVGFLNAWQLSGDVRFLEYSVNCWQFVKEKLRDPKGEWYWGIDGAGSLIQKDKAGFWKCPYHTTRACMEVIKHIDQILKP